MHRRILLLVTALGLAGCAQESGPGLHGAFEDVEPIPAGLAEALGLPADFLMINGSVVEGRIGSSGSWSTMVRAQPPPVQHTGATTSTPGAAGGGGTRIELPAHDIPLQVRLKPSGSLDGFHVVWVGSDGQSFGSEVHLGNTTGDEVLEIPFPLGVRSVFAVLVQAEEPVAVTVLPLRLEAVLVWEVRDSVHPVNPGGAAPMSEAERERMADRYVVPAPARATLHTATAFDGTWTPDKGTDVDLEFLDPTGRSVGYVGSGGGALPLPADPAQASEILETEVTQAGDWTVRVGYISTACAGCFYHNAGPVPYQATITLTING